MDELFHSDNAAFFDYIRLRSLARRGVEASSLIRRAKAGDLVAARALHIGFWPFVHDFEHAIDKKANLVGLPRQPLRAKFGRGKVNQVFVGAAKAVREMKEEEGVHSRHWLKDADNLGLTNLEGKTSVGVQELIDSANSDDLVKFFSVMAGTEFVAEELGAVLAHAPKFTSLFKRGRWVWGKFI